MRAPCAPPGDRPRYVPVVAVWPATGEQAAVLGYDLMSDPERSAALERAQATRSTVFTPAIDFLLAGRGYAALRPIYAPTGASDAPVGFVTTRFSMRRIANVLRALPPDMRVRLTIDGSEVYSTEDPPGGGVTRSLGLGGRRWLLTASGEPAGHSSSLAILLGGAILMVMLGAFTWTRASSERRLLRANEAERAAREHSEGLERNAARLQARADLLQRLAAALSAAALPNEVAEAAVPFLFEAFAADLCTVGIAWGDDVRTLKVPASAPGERHWRPVPRETSTPTADALRGRQVMELHGHDEIARRYPPDLEQLLEGISSIVVVPLPRQTGAVGVAFAESRTLDASERGLLDAIAEELTQALDRAALLERERDARLDAELLEQNATRLAAAATATDVAESTVADFEAFGADVVFVWRLVGSERLEGLASSDLPASTRTRYEEYPLELGGLVADVMREGKVIAVAAERYDALYPTIAAERQRVGLESLVALPLRAASGEVIGAIFAASRRQRWARDDRRPLLVGMAEQAGVALERATLFEAEREARRLAELLERNAAQLAAAVTVQDVARSTVADLHDAGFGPSAVHTYTDDGELEILADRRGAGGPPRRRGRRPRLRHVSRGRDAPHRIRGRRRRRGRARRAVSDPRHGQGANRCAGRRGGPAPGRQPEAARRPHGRFRPAAAEQLGAARRRPRRRGAVRPRGRARAPLCGRRQGRRCERLPRAPRRVARMGDDRRRSRATARRGADRGARDVRRRPPARRGRRAESGRQRGLPPARARGRLPLGGARRERDRGGT